MACFLVPMSLGIITTFFRKIFPKKWHIEWLNMMLWGAVVMLVVEHLAHREISLYPPFLTAGISEIIPEMISVGLPMTVFSVSAWAGIVLITELILAKNVLKIKTKSQKKIL